MSSDLKRMLLLIVLLGGIYYAHIVIQKYYNKDVHCTTSVNGKILDYTTTTGLSVYYNYRYHYNGKVFNDQMMIDELDTGLVGRCYEVRLDPKDPDNSKLNLDKEIDCKIYYETFMTVVPK